MDDFLLGVYLDEMLFECEKSFAAIERLNEALRSTGPGADVFGPAQNLIHHSAALSRMLWPCKGFEKQSHQRAQSRGQHLRTALGLATADHPIKARVLRDNLEHFDERLDAWAEQSQNRVIIKRFLGQRSAIGGNSIGDKDIIHHYDPATNVYAFRGEPFDVQALADGVSDLHRRITAKLEQLDRNRRIT